MFCKVLTNQLQIQLYYFSDARRCFTQTASLAFSWGTPPPPIPQIFSWGAKPPKPLPGISGFSWGACSRTHTHTHTLGCVCPSICFKWFLKRFQIVLKSFQIVFELFLNRFQKFSRPFSRKSRQQIGKKSSQVKRHTPIGASAQVNVKTCWKIDAEKIN